MFAQFLNGCLSGFRFVFVLCGPSVLPKDRRVPHLSVHSLSSPATLPGSSFLYQCLSCRTKKNVAKSKSLSVNSFMTHYSKKQVGSQKERQFLKKTGFIPQATCFLGNAQRNVSCFCQVPLTTPTGMFSDTKMPEFPLCFFLE